ncbi:uncharacterized protein V1516DRAFT_678039 [Lipomyces oligophaga]|uniref:uncharacterized protein n=1 Tax=Lipomyces oligophaga TaxID=45792 RepID=UPI0034CDD161
MNTRMPHVLVVGGSFGGHAFAYKLISLLLEKKIPLPHITLLDPRRGLLNPVAIPRSLVEPRFAEITFARPGEFSREMIDNVDFVHAKASYMTDTHVFVKSPLYEDTLQLKYDFALVATGRHHPDYIMPSQPTKEEFLALMNFYVLKFRDANHILIVGGGAVGIEVAGELRYHYPSKSVTLVHPHAELPPEPVSEKFKRRTLEALKILGVDVQLNTRVKTETETGVITVDGREITADCVLWTSSRGKVVTEFMDKEIFENVLDSTGALKVNYHMNLSGGQKSFENLYAIGDVNDFPVIKTAGGAIHQAAVAAQNVARALAIQCGREDTWPERASIEPWGIHTAILIGKEMGVSQLMGLGDSAGYKESAAFFGDDMSTSKCYESLGIRKSTRLRTLEDSHDGSVKALEKTAASLSVRETTTSV